MKYVLAILLMLLALPAAAQQTDPRIAEPMIQALQAQVALLQAALAVTGQDAQAREATVWSHPAMNAWRWASNPMAKK